MLKEILKNFVSKKKTISFPEGVSVAPGQALKVVDNQGKVDTIFKRSLRIRMVDAGSCNACEWECSSLMNPLYDLQRLGIDFVASPRHADVLLVTGPVARQMELALRKTYIATPEPRLVVACGDCAVNGGIYRGSYAVTDGVANVIPVNACIPGCPPTPSAILKGIAQLVNSDLK